jgi:geranylgeranyl diphosphate synthase, type I
VKTVPVPDAVARARELVLPALAAAVDELADPQMRLIAGYQLGLWDAAGDPRGARPGKVIRPALAVLSAAAAGVTAAGVPGAVAVELVHNFSLLHDDVMDRDVQRRHRPTGWVVFGEGQAILAGNAMLTLAVDVLHSGGPETRRALPLLLTTVQELISGQSADLALEGRRDARLDEVLQMAQGKTAVLISCAASIGALIGDAAGPLVEGLAEYGRLIGLAFQVVDDILGIAGDPQQTGKSVSSDLRAGKRSVPVVAALSSGTAAGHRLADLFEAGPLETDEQVALGAALVADAGGLRWAEEQAHRLLVQAAQVLAGLDLPRHVGTGFRQMAEYLVGRVG